MNIYLVGGAVRDELLGIAVAERDWVVTGATESDMLAAGYQRADESFPVFRHPATGDEYALARRERKTGAGYRGFEVACGPDVSLDEDLARRDLTINAMARDKAGTLIDPHGGREDLDRRRLRHVTAAFVEDPLRLVRLARFTAQLGAFDFQPAEETLPLLDTIVASGELRQVTPARRWQALRRALRYPYAARFVSTLRQCGALAQLYPWIDERLATGDPLPDAFNRLGDVAAENRFAVMCVALGLDAREAAADLPVERGYRRQLEWLRAVQRQCGQAQDAAGLVDLFARLGLLQHPQRLDDLLVAADALRLPAGRCRALRPALDAARAVDVEPLRSGARSGEALGAALRAQRISVVAEVLACTS